MTIDRANTLISAITSTLYDLRADLFDGKAPASQIYLAIGSNLNEYTAIVNVMDELGLVTFTTETVKLTAKGYDLGKKCSAILDEVRG